MERRIYKLLEVEKVKNTNTQRYDESKQACVANNCVERLNVLVDVKILKN